MNENTKIIRFWFELKWKKGIKFRYVPQKPQTEKKNWIINRSTNLWHLWDISIWTNQQQKKKIPFLGPFFRLNCLNNNRLAGDTWVKLPLRVIWISHKKNSIYWNGIGFTSERFNRNKFLVVWKILHVWPDKSKLMIKRLQDVSLIFIFTP